MTKNQVKIHSMQIFIVGFSLLVHMNKKEKEKLHKCVIKYVKLYSQVTYQDAATANMDTDRTNKHPLMGRLGVGIIFSVKS